GNINQNLTGYYALIPYCSFKELDFCYYAKVSITCKTTGPFYIIGLIDQAYKLPRYFFKQYIIIKK
ncbi:MAG: hypothetical protein ACOX6E_10625, partial [Syntrophomonadaceae bacterium]